MSVIISLDLEYRLIQALEDANAALAKVGGAPKSGCRCGGRCPRCSAVKAVRTAEAHIVEGVVAAVVHKRAGCEADCG